MVTCLPAKKLFWTSAILIAGALLAATPGAASAQGLYGWSHQAWGVHYPAWGYAIGMPGYYADFRAQSYYSAPWIAGYEAPWYGVGGCGYSPYYQQLGASRYPWIWNRHAGFVTRGRVAASPPASIKVFKNPFYKVEAASPSDEPKAAASEGLPKGPLRVVANPYFAAK